MIKTKWWWGLKWDRCLLFANNGGFTKRLKLIQLLLQKRNVIYSVLMVCMCEEISKPSKRKQEEGDCWDNLDVSDLVLKLGDGSCHSMFPKETVRLSFRQKSWYCWHWLWLFLFWFFSRQWQWLFLIHCNWIWWFHMCQHTNVHPPDKPL